MARQHEDCVELIRRRGWQLVGEYSDNDRSAAANKKPRPGFESMLRAIERGELDVIVGWNLDRILRNRRDQLRLMELCEPRRTVIACCRGPELDMSTPAGRMMADMLATIARHEIEQKGDRSRRAQQQAAAQGRRVGGRRPFGYEDDGLTLRPAEAAAIERAYQAVIEGVSLGSIARSWNAAGLNTGKTGWKTGAPTQWRHDTVRTVLLNPRNAGLRRYNGEITGRAEWPAIVGEDTFRAAEYRIKNHNGVGLTRGARQLLTGVARCGECGTTVHGGGAGHGKPIYRCKTNRHINRLADPIDEYVSEVAIAYLSRPDVAAQVFAAHDARPEAKGLREEAEALRLRLESLATEFADGELTAAQLRTATGRIRSRLAEVEGQMASSGELPVLTNLLSAVDVRVKWATLDNDQRRLIIDTIMEVRIHPVGAGVRNFRPESVEINWR